MKIQHSFSYSDGFGREFQKKIQAEPGPVPKRDANGKIIVGADGQPEITPNDVSPRWVGSGWTVFNNKGKPVRQFEPFFTDTHRFEFDVRIGVSPVLFYDPVERVVATLHPNHTWEKVVFDPWRQESWDVSDTVLVADPKTDLDVGNFFRRLADAEYLPTWYAQRQGGALGLDEQAAAVKTAIHAGTPAVAHADSLGRTFLTVAHNKFKYSDTADPPTEEFHRTRVIFDIEGNQREVIDARDRVVMRYDYDIAGPEKDEDTANNRIHQASMEAGERWTLNDVAGQPLYSWDSRDHQFRTAYDPLRRPTDAFLRKGTGAELLVGHTVYGESRPNSEANNLRGQVVQVFDQAGVVTSDDYDFKGNLLSSQRQLAQAYNTTLNWPTVPLEADIYTSRTRYDALNRPTDLTTPHTPAMQPSVIRPGYNEANLLERVEANLRGAQSATPFVTNIDYDAKGQRTQIDYATKDGKLISTSYKYDRETFRLIHLYTRRGVDPATRQGVTFTDDCDNPQPPPPTIAAPESPPEGKSCGLQNLRYTYDPVGNITHIRDDAQQTLYFRNQRVEPSADYTYDALYRLIEAIGREHLGQAGAAPSPSSYNDKPRVGILFSASDGNAMGRYLQRYVYDAVGNFQEMIHRGTDPANPGWTRAYAYLEPSLLEPGKPSNRLTSTTVGGTTETYSIGGNGYDVHGNMLRMPQLQIMRWDFQDQLQMTQRQAVNAEDEEGVQRQAERTWYVYDASGQRVRKVTELATGQVKDERIYLDGFEIYRRHGANPLVRETLHIMDDKQRIALVETRTEGNEPGVPAQLMRYQFGNHLGSANLELDHLAQIISYEEYYPYGSTSYQAVRSASEVSLKRYRYTGKERDEETGLYYHGARYYSPWIGKWTSPDPSFLSDGTNIYCYVDGNPIRKVDPNGKDGWDFFTAPARPARTPGVAARRILHTPPSDESQVAEFITGWYQAGADVQLGLVLGAVQELRDKVRAITDPKIYKNYAFQDKEGSRGGGDVIDRLKELNPVYNMLVEGAKAFDSGDSRQFGYHLHKAGFHLLETLAIASGTARLAPKATPKVSTTEATALGTAGKPVSPARSSTSAIKGSDPIKHPLAGVTDAEIDAAVSTPGSSNLILQAPAPGGPPLTASGAPTTNAALTGSRYNRSGNIMVNEHTVQSTSSAAGATGNAATRIRVHTADPNPKLSPTSNSASGNTLNIEQGSRRFVPDNSPSGGSWHPVSKMDDAMLNKAHIPIHR